MKRIILTLSLIGLILMMISCGSKTAHGVVKTKNGDQSVELYDDGRIFVMAVVDSETLRGWGNYEINGEEIIIHWDNGMEQRGNISIGSDYDKGINSCRVHSLDIEGVKYSWAWLK